MAACLATWWAIIAATQPRPKRASCDADVASDLLRGMGSLWAVVCLPSPVIASTYLSLYLSHFLPISLSLSISLHIPLSLRLANLLILSYRAQAP